MIKLDKKQQIQQAVHVDALAKAKEKVANAIGEYNQALTEAANWLDDIKDTMQSYHDERSEKWQEGDKGSAYSAWIDTWSELDTDELDLPDMEHSEKLDELPLAPEE